MISTVSVRIVIFYISNITIDLIDLQMFFGVGAKNLFMIKEACLFRHIRIKLFEHV